jgi:hypothetical protein
MVALPPAPVRDYDDGPNFPKTGNELAAEKAYRQALRCMWATAGRGYPRRRDHGERARIASSIR